jgi:ABC-2 type transport system ATP-binding protein
MAMNISTSFVVHTQNLSKAYEDTRALKSLDLKVPKNSIFGFLGPNGAGKTTTIKLLLGLIRPTEGGGTVFGKDIGRNSIEIRKRIGYLAQGPRFYEYMTARETLHFRAKFFYAGPNYKIGIRIAEMLALVGLEDKADRPIKSFSGGERQRLGIAQAQINHPDLLILDEPSANLDPIGRRDVLNIIENMREHSTIFYSTHILDDVQQVSDTVAILNHGELVAQAPLDELLNGSEKVYFLKLKGDTSSVYNKVLAQTWVSDITTDYKNGQTTWRVSLVDVNAAETQLQRLVLEDGQITVTEFRRAKNELEDVFMNLVKE